MLVSGRVWVPDGSCGPGRLADVAVPVVELDDRGLTAGAVHVVDGRFEDEFPLLVAGDGRHDGASLRFEHHLGGGPMSSGRERLEAHAFGVVNVAFTAARMCSVFARSFDGVDGVRVRIADASTGERGLVLGPGSGFVRSVVPGFAGLVRYWAEPAHDTAAVARVVAFGLLAAVRSDVGLRVVQDAVARALVAAAFGTVEPFVWLGDGGDGPARRLAFSLWRVQAVLEGRAPIGVFEDALVGAWARMLPADGATPTGSYCLALVDELRGVRPELVGPVITAMSQHGLSPWRTVADS